MDFAQARYYNKQHGRFTSPDQPFADQWQSNPQSWSLYAYARNNPLNLTDPLGMTAGCPEAFPDCLEEDGKFYLMVKGEKTIIDENILTIDSGVKGEEGSVKHENEINTLTVGEALQQQKERRNRFYINNILGLAGHGISKLFGKIGGLFRGKSPTPPPTTAPSSSGTSNLPGLPKTAAKPLGLGSTGRTVPASLTEQLAMESAMANPQAGTPIRRIVMSDARWQASQGWVKMTQNINGVEIHYVRNTITGAVDDFKFK